MSADLGSSEGAPSGEAAASEHVDSVAQALDASCSDEAAQLGMSNEVTNCSMNRWTFPIRYENISSWPAGEQTTLRNAMDAWKNATGGFVTFQELPPGSTVSPRMGFRQCINGGGQSPVGMNPDGNGVVSVQLKGCGSWTTMHELGHTLGMIHQHQRADRDRYLILRQNKFCAPRGCPGQPADSNVCGSSADHNCDSLGLFGDSVIRCSPTDTTGGYVLGGFDMGSIMIYPSGFPAQECCASNPSGCGMVQEDGTMIPVPGTVSPGDAAQLIELYREQESWSRFRPIVTADHGSHLPLDTRLKSSILLTGSPAIARNGSSNVMAFATGADSHVYTKRATNETSWSSGAWTDLGGDLTSDPAAVSLSASEVAVVAVGTDGNLWQKWSINDVWGGWGSLGRPGASAISAPAIASMAANRADVFVRSDDKLYQKTLLNGAWGSWIERGCCIQGKPSAVSWGPGRIDVVAVGADGAVWHRPMENDVWFGWSSIGGAPMPGTSPAIASPGSGVLHAYVTGQNGNLWFQTWSNAGWSGWVNLGGSPLGSPSATTFTNGHAHVAAKINNGQYDGVWQKRWQ